jgi:hypothetical protein
VQADVTYVTVRLGNGAVPTLHPVTVYGTRAVAFAGPVRAEITEVTAYSRHGEIAFAVPFNWPARVSGPIGSGTVQGKAWSATAYLGPRGTCIALADSARPGGGCFQSAPAVAGVVTLNQDSLDPGSTPEIAGGVAPTSATRVVVTQPDGTAVRVRLVTVGDEKLFVLVLRPGGQATALDRLRQLREGGRIVIALSVSRSRLRQGQHCNAAAMRCTTLEADELRQSDPPLAARLRPMLAELCA